MRLSDSCALDLDLAVLAYVWQQKEMWEKGQEEEKEQGVKREKKKRVCVCVPDK